MQQNKPFNSSKKKLNNRHDKWRDFLDEFNFSFKYKTGESNKKQIKKTSFITVMSTQVTGFNSLKKASKRSLFQSCSGGFEWKRSKKAAIQVA